MSLNKTEVDFSAPSTWRGLPTLSQQICVSWEVPATPICRPKHQLWSADGADQVQLLAHEDGGGGADLKTDGALQFLLLLTDLEVQELPHLLFCTLWFTGSAEISIRSRF